jgi:hypothetical protein
MPEKIENLIKWVYRIWKRQHPSPQGTHPDEELLACFLEGKLSEREAGELKAHLVSCQDCLEALAFNPQLRVEETQEVPAELVSRVKNLVSPQSNHSLLEIFIRFKDKAMEIISTTGDVLVGQELVPAPVLRSRAIKDFKDEVTILKDFEDIRLELKLENKSPQAFNLIVVAKEKGTQEIVKDLRVSLFKDDIELESYLIDAAAVIFEHVLLGKYTVEVSSLKKKVASVLLEIKL